MEGRCGDGGSRHCRTILAHAVGGFRHAGPSNESLWTVVPDLIGGAVAAGSRVGMAVGRILQAQAACPSLKRYNAVSGIFIVIHAASNHFRAPTGYIRHMKFLCRLLGRFSVRRLVSFCVAIVLLPVFAGWVFVFLALEQVTHFSQQQEAHLRQETQSLAALHRELNAWEGHAWAYLSRRDAASLQTLQAAHEKLSGQILSLVDAHTHQNEGWLASLKSFRREERELFEQLASCLQVWAKPLSESSLCAALKTSAAFEGFQAVNAQFRELQVRYLQEAREAVEGLEARSLDLELRMMESLAIILPLTGLLLVAFAHLMQNPIRQIDHAIRVLGAGEFAQPVQVYGPADLVYLGERLEWLRTRLNDLELAKQRFVRNLSHEVKTPLANIHEGAGLLLDEVVGGLNEEQREISRILSKNAKRLDSLIADLISYSQTSTRALQQKFLPVDMHALVVSVLEDQQLQWRAKYLQASLALEPLTLMGNAGQLRSLVDNLLSNAVKYSPDEGGIRIALYSQGGHMILEVEDDGPGVDPNERERVFEPFFRGRSAYELNLPGSGFGLAIVSECVASHHGHVKVLESHDEQAGALFKVSIPMQSPSLGLEHSGLG